MSLWFFLRFFCIMFWVLGSTVGYFVRFIYTAALYPNRSVLLKISLRNIGSILDLFHMSLFDWWCLTPFPQYFSYIMAVSFIGEGNRRTQRKPPTCRKSLTNFITSCCTPRTDRDSNSQHQWWYALIALVVVNPTTIQSRPRRPLIYHLSFNRVRLATLLELQWNIWT
jgi:hypothetical protein